MRGRQKEESNFDQMKAVSRLLEVAEKKSYLDDSWQEGQKPHFSLSLQMRTRLGNKKDEKLKNRPEEDRSNQKRHEKDRLQQLIKESVNNEETYLYEKELPCIANRQRESPPKLGACSQLRSFNSNMTFYRTQRESSDKKLNSSLTFYGKGLKDGQQRTQSNRYMKQKVAQEIRFPSSKANSSIVYFKPNKSQTIRELLNQMKISREKNNQIVLNSTHYQEPIEDEEPNQIKYLNEHQAKELNKYRNLLPFREDQTVLFTKIKEGQNIWKRKFKQSWLKRKQQLEGRKFYLKRLIVND